MHSLKTLVAIAIAGVATAAPTAVAGTSQTWDVTNWKAECTGAGCAYAFKVTGTETGIFPGFSAHCTGGDYGSWQSCKMLSASTSTASTNPAVSAKLRPENHSDPNNVAYMSVELTFDNKKNDYTYIGHHAATFNLDNGGANAFTIVPSQASAVLLQ